MSNGFYQTWLAATLLAFFVAGCDYECEELDKDIKNLQMTLQLVQLQKTVQAAQQSPAEGRPERDATSTPVARQRLILRTIGSLEENFFTFPNKSYGKFTAQVTVAATSLTGLVDGESLGFLEYRQPTAAAGARRYYVGAVYDAADDGFRVEVHDPEVPGALGTPITFPGGYEVDLRIQQTDTDLSFFARATPADQSATGWMQVHTIPLPLDPAFFHTYIGVRHAEKRASFGFDHFALEGDAIGGTLEYAVSRQIRDSGDAVRAAQAKLRLNPPDLDGAEADLDNALAINEQASTDLGNTRFQMQDTRLAAVAFQNVAKVRAQLMAAIAVLDKHSVAQSVAEAPKLDVVTATQAKAMANLLGWSSPLLKIAPNVFSLRIP